jgi:hypothetical protein
MGLLARLFWGETDEVREARRRMAADRSDPRRVLVAAVLAVSYDLDPGYLPAHSTMAITDWYEVESAVDLLSRTIDDLAANGHVAYDHFRMCFLARGGYAAGLIDESTSWRMAFRHAKVIQQHYQTWRDYGHGYCTGHIGFRASLGDDPDQLAAYRKRINARLANLEQGVWSSVSIATPLD